MNWVVSLFVSLCSPVFTALQSTRVLLGAKSMLFESRRIIFFSVVSQLNRELNREISKWSGVELDSFEVIFIGREKRQLSETQGIHKTQA